MGKKILSPQPITPGKTRILRDIARLGSLPFQEAACLQATRQEYVLLDELILTALARVQLETSNKVLAAKWSAVERDALKRFADRVDKLFGQSPWRDAKVSLATILKEDAAMKSIRAAAKDCLDQLRTNFSLEELLAD